jgi:hypothetical protein
MAADDNPLKSCPAHRAGLRADEWSHAYRREGRLPAALQLRQQKYWAPVGRVDNVYGDRNLLCSLHPGRRLRLRGSLPWPCRCFDLFKIGIGPSSSHTVGRCAPRACSGCGCAHEGLLAATARVQVILYGSLGATGKGHGSDKAVLLGLAGHEPDTVDVEAIPALLDAIRAGS